MASHTSTQSTSWLVYVCILCCYVSQCWAIQKDWLGWGGNKENWRFSDHACFDSKTIGGLKTVKPLWNITAGGTVAATPGVCGDFVYYVDWKSSIVKLSLDGKEVWKVNAKDFLPAEQRVGVRTTPVFSEGCKELFVATQWSNSSYLLALDAGTGKIKYPPVKLDSNPASRATQSPTYYNGAIYIGLSSNQENSVELTKCCDFRGSMLSVDAATGKINWQTYLCPEGWSGCPVWGSSPAIDDVRGQVCVGTGNLYSIPDASIQCLKNAPDGSLKQQECLPKNVYSDAIVCLDIKTGQVKWGHQAHGVDIWGNSFDPNAPNIKQMFPKSKFVIGLDRDFAQAPIFIRGTAGNKDRVVATSKGGITWGLDVTSGDLLWQTYLSLDTDKKPGSSMFGSCTNGVYYCAGLHWFGVAQGRVTCLNVQTGKKVWAKDWQANAGVYGPLTCTQKHVFAPVLDAPGTLAVLDIATGAEVVTYSTGKSLFCGPAIVNGVMYLGIGYGNGGQPGQNIMAIPIPGCSGAAGAPAPTTPVPAPTTPTPKAPAPKALAPKAPVPKAAAPKAPAPKAPAPQAPAPKAPAPKGPSPAKSKSKAKAASVDEPVSGMAADESGDQVKQAEKVYDKASAELFGTDSADAGVGEAGLQAAVEQEDPASAGGVADGVSAEKPVVKDAASSGDATPGDKMVGKPDPAPMKVPGGGDGGSAPAAKTGGDALVEKTGGAAPVEKTGGDAPVEKTGGDAPVEKTGGDASVEKTAGAAAGVAAGVEKKLKVTKTTVGGGKGGSGEVGVGGKGGSGKVDVGAEGGKAKRDKGMKGKKKGAKKGEKGGNLGTWKGGKGGKPKGGKVKGGSSASGYKIGFEIEP